MPSPRSSPRLARGRLAAVLLLPLSLLASTAARAADWSVSDVTIEATIAPDGDMTVTETRTYEFTENFRWIEEWIPLSGSQGIGDIAVREGGPGGVPLARVEGAAAADAAGTFVVTEEAGNVIIRWWFAKRAGPRTFSLSYQVDDPVVVHNDVAELYWKFVGENWEVGTGHVLVNLHLPAGGTVADILAFGHEPPQGQVTVVDPTLVRFEVDNLAAATYVESRVAFPIALVPDCPNRSGRDALRDILSEEDPQAASEGNAERWDLLIKMGLAAALVLAVVILGWRLMRRHGRERRSVDRPD